MGVTYISIQSNSYQLNEMATHTHTLQQPSPYIYMFIKIILFHRSALSLSILQASTIFLPYTGMSWRLLSPNKRKERRWEEKKNYMLGERWLGDTQNLA